MKILITGATDGIGLQTARNLNSIGHDVLIHGRNEQKLLNIGDELDCETFQANFSRLSEVSRFAKDVKSKHTDLDVLINNAGVYKTVNKITEDGCDMRFTVNFFAPFLLTKELLPIMGSASRIINVSSAAQSSVDFNAVVGKVKLDNFQAYAQSKLALTMWSRHLGQQEGPTVIAVNPGSLLATKMVTEGFKIDGNNPEKGTNILVDLSLEEEYAKFSGSYFDNDAGQFSDPEADGLDDDKTTELIILTEKILLNNTNSAEDN